MKKLTSLADVETALNELQQVEAEIELESAEANKVIAQTRTEIVPTIAEKEGIAKRLRTAIENWAYDHREDEELFPAGRKTLELRAGTIAFRSSTPSLVLLPGWRTEDVVSELREADAAIKKAGIKTPDPTLDKTGIKKLFDKGKIDEKGLKALGLKIESTESLSITTKTLEAYEA